MSWKLGLSFSGLAGALLWAKHSTASDESSSAGFSLQRRWQNQLGSVMIIDNVNSDTGDFSGQYCSSVGQAEKFYRLTGRYDTASATGTPTLGWTVTWKNSFKNAHSTTTWSGQYQHGPSGTPTLLTKWLLTSETKPADNWRSTLVGSDVFTPSPESSKGG
jgi:hypothetical protein